MAISSDHVIKEVSKKLKYYFDIKRLEDGFDLSGVACPRLDHPPTKARPTLLYDGLHDRPLKHYFSPQQVKAALTQFKQPQGKNNREKEIRRQLERYFRRYQFNENATKKEARSAGTSTSSAAVVGGAPDGMHHRKARPARSARPGHSRPQTSVLDDAYYKPSGKSSKKLKPEVSGGFGVSLKKRKGAFRGGQPVLRSAPPTGTSRHETERLVNIASRLLVATETIDLKNPPTGKYQGKKEKDDTRGAPRNFESGQQSGPRGRHSVYTYDINGRRILLRRKEESPPRSPTPPGNYVTITGEPADDQAMPRWLRKKVARERDSELDRPQSAFGATTPHPPEDSARPHSALTPRKPRTSSESEPGRPGQVREGWASESPSAGEGESTTTEIAVQTGGELLKNYEPSECILYDGERAEYKVHVFTGSRLGASTKANVKIALFGDKGRTEDIYLENSSTHKIKFQKGQEDIFTLDTFYVGPLRKIAIGHDRNELGFGWFLERAEVRDMKHRIMYKIPCERWLSSQELDKRTLRELAVDYSTSFTPEERHLTEQLDEPLSTPRDAPSGSGTDRGGPSDTASSRTSIAGQHSDRSDRSSSRGSRTPPRRRTSYTSLSSDYTSASSTSSSRSNSPQSTPRKAVVEETEKKEEKPKGLPPLRPLQRRDTFFDQRTAGPDYTSVIDNLSQTTEERRFSEDFDKPAYEPRDPTGKPLALVEDEDTARLKEEEVAGSEADQAEIEKILRLPDPPTTPPPEVTRDVYLDGFKAGIQAAKTSKEVAVADSDTESEKEDTDRGPSVHDAAKSGDLERMKKIIDKNSSKKDAVDERGWAPVHLAAAGGHTDIIKWLAVCHADLNVETPTSYTAMHIAAMHGHTNTMMVLFAMGAKLASKSVEHQMPLHVAAIGGHLETVKWLVANRTPLDTADNLGRTALDLAEEHHHEDVAQFLRSCQQEQQRPGSGLALIRSNSKQRTKSPPVNSPPSAALPTSGLSDRSYTSYSSDYSDSTNSEADSPRWKNENNDRPKTSVGRRSRSAIQSETEANTKTDPKHDEELMEKRAVYDDQQRRMTEKNVSFLDAIRDEVG